MSGVRKAASELLCSTTLSYTILPGGSKSKYCPFKDSGSEKLCMVWFLESESLNGQYMDPLGSINPTFGATLNFEALVAGRKPLQRQRAPAGRGEAALRERQRPAPSAGLDPWERPLLNSEFL